MQLRRLWAARRDEAEGEGDAVRIGGTALGQHSLREFARRRDEGRFV